MFSVSSRVTAMQRNRFVACNMPHSRSVGTRMQPNQTLLLLPKVSPFTQRRNYIFLPSTMNDIMKLLKSQSCERGKIMVKLSTRWHDQLGAALDRYDKLLRKTSSGLLSNIRSSPSAAHPINSTTVSSKTMNRYKSLKTWGMNRLVTHYNAKKRVFARRRMTLKTFRRMNASEVRVYREQYYNQKKLRLHQGLNRLRARVEKKRAEVSDWLMNTDRINRVSSDFEKNTSAIRGDKATWKSLTLTEPSQTSWFDKEGYPLTSREETGRFVNPWLSQSTNGENGLRKFLRWKMENWMKKLGLTDGQDECATSVRGVDPNDCNEIAEKVYRHGTRSYTGAETWTDQLQQTIKLAWLGHATTLVSFPGGFTILTDPHFSNYAGPMKRNDPPPINVVGLPSIDCVLISHDHMDHLDYWTILELVDSDKVNFWVVPLGIKEWLINKAGVCPDKIVELEWWEGVRFSKEPFSNVGVPPLPPKMEGLVHAFDTTSGKSLKNNQPEQTDRNELVITCAPAQHWCSRTPFDRNRRLWCSYAVHATLSSVVNPGSTPQTHSFYFAGDTGLPPEFPLHHQIGDRLGPFDLAAIPIGAYEPRWFMKESHCDPAGAVVIHQAIRAQKSVAIHFDTFNLADEPQAEPPRLLVEEVLRVNEEIGRLADEVVAVAGEVNIVVGQETSVALSTTDDQILKNGDELVEQTKTVNDILPSLVDFAVIKQGHFIESSPK